MKRFTLFALTLLTGSLTAAADPAPTPASIITRVSATDAALAWDGLRLGMTLEEVRAALGRPLTLNPGSEGMKTIDRYAGSVTRRGVKVDLSFENDAAEAALVFIRAGFPSGAKVDQAALTGALRAHVPALEPVDGSDALMLPGTDYQIAPQVDGLYLGANWLF